MLRINSFRSGHVAGGLKLVGLVFSFLGLLWACSASGPGNTPQAISVTVTPHTVNVRVTESVQLTATVHNSTNGSVTWSVRGAGCENAYGAMTCGLISITGIYTAPPSVPSPARVTVTARSLADNSKSDIATITILGAANNASEWTWVSGSNMANQSGVYGTQGTAAPSSVPGARYRAVSWMDSTGKLWLFGGSTAFGDNVNDLWRYDPVTNEWTWVSGSNMANQAGIYGTQATAAPSNIPGARYGAVSWLDSSGKLWLFGGEGVDSASNQGDLGDLWKYDSITNEWTWVSGSNMANQAGIYGTLATAAPSNIPGARYGAVSWLDPGGKLWLFGGFGHDSTGTGGYLNDLWMFDPTRLEWTWVSGSNIIDQAGIYGTQGAAAPSNIPGARRAAVSWIDSTGKLWLIGGVGYDSTGTGGFLSSLNDLWRYDPLTTEWTWVSGANTANQAGIYGTQGTPASSNFPGARSGAAAWLDSNSNLWLFGGEGFFASLNDLWKYDPITLEWTWVSGSNTRGQAGVYGTKGIADPSNVPGARFGALAWSDSNGNLWLFGGGGSDSVGTDGYLNDLWRYTR